MRLLRPPRRLPDAGPAPSRSSETPGRGPCPTGRRLLMRGRTGGSLSAVPSGGLRWRGLRALSRRTGALPVASRVVMQKKPTRLGRPDAGYSGRCHPRRCRMWESACGGLPLSEPHEVWRSRRRGSRKRVAVGKGCGNGTRRAARVTPASPRKSRRSPKRPPRTLASASTSAWVFPPRRALRSAGPRVGRATRRFRRRRSAGNGVEIVRGDEAIASDSGETCAVGRLTETFWSVRSWGWGARNGRSWRWRSAGNGVEIVRGDEAIASDWYKQSGVDAGHW